MPELYTYRYPNAASYALLPINAAHGAFVGQGRALRHGYIFGYKDSTASTIPIAGAISGLRQINYQSSKVFQFNPAALNMAVQMMPVEDPALGGTGQALPDIGVGLASSSLELFFDRTEEIARANNNAGDEKWRDLGVQMDLYELLKVISGGDASLLGEYTDPGADGEAGLAGGSVQAGSLNHLTGAFFDAAIAGSQIMFKPFVVVFNPNLSLHVQRMTSFAFTYLRFTSDLVPTTVKVEIGLEITNMGTKAYVTSGGGVGPTTAATAAAAAPPGVTDTAALIPIAGSF